jgi:hypothetical protein
MNGHGTIGVVKVQENGTSAHIPDLAPCDFFLFGYMKEQLKGGSFAEEEELLSVLSELMSAIPPDMILRVFADWDRRLRRCLLMEGE